MTPTQYRKYLIAIATGLTEEQAKRVAMSNDDLAHLNVNKLGK